MVPKLPGIKDGSPRRGTDEGVTGGRVDDRPKKNGLIYWKVDGLILVGVVGLNIWNVADFGAILTSVLGDNSPMFSAGDCE